MAKEQIVRREPAQKAIKLFVRLMLTRRPVSLTELAEYLECTKQTILRLIEEMETAWQIPIIIEKQGRQNYYHIEKQKDRQLAVNISESELHALSMCATFTCHLLGKELFEEATEAIIKNSALLPPEMHYDTFHFASFTPGTIDYTPFQDHIRTLLAAMDQKKICRVTYKNLTADQAKSFYIKPLKIFSYKDTVYVHARLAREPNGKISDPDYDPLLAIHRIQNIEMDDRSYEYPQNYNFQKVYDQTFGIVKNEAFTATIEFSGWAARYVSERVWSVDQKIVATPEGGIRLQITSSSKSELVTWILSFGTMAKTLKPKWLKEKIKEHIQAMYALNECG